MVGKLYLCPTPIGNLKDITLRVLETLRSVDLVAAEDTRRAGKLLTHFDIKKPLVSFYEQNELKVLPKLLEELRRGKMIAQVSDAGMPGIADPGHRLVKACIEAGIPVEVLPGPSALLTAAVVSGLPTDDIRFLGFFPRKAGARLAVLDDLARTRSTTVFYESPRRIKETIALIAERLVGRRVFIGRELTKLFEEHLRGTAQELAEELGKRPEIKGELVVAVAGAREKPAARPEDIKKAVEVKIGQGFKKSEAIKEVAAELGISKRLVYETAHGDR